MSSKRDFLKKRQHRQWQDGVYQNPYFSKPKYDWKKLSKGIGISVFALLLIIIFLYLPALRIDSYIVEGTEFINPDEIKKEAESYFSGKKFMIVPKNHVLFISEEKATHHLFDAFQLDRLQITKEGRAIKISVSEKICRVIWETNNERFLIDETGTVLSRVIEEVTEAEELTEIPEELLIETPTQPTLTTIRSIRQEPVSVGQYVLEPEIITNILDLLLELREGPLSIASLEIDSEEANFLQVNMEDGYSVFFDPTINMSPQLESLITVLKGESADTSTYNYIDVRFGERVYINDK